MIEVKAAQGTIMQHNPMNDPRRNRQTQAAP